MNKKIKEFFKMKNRILSLIVVVLLVCYYLSYDSVSSGQPSAVHRMGRWMRMAAPLWVVL